MLVDGNKISELLKNYSEQLYKHQPDEKTSQKNNPENIIEGFNKEVAKQKYEFRDKLLRLISRLIWIQLFFFNVIVLVVISAVVFKCSYFKSNISESVLGFLKYYISVTIVELLGMLWFVMKYVFRDKNT